MVRNIKIKVASTELSMTQKSISKAIEISRQTIYAIEKRIYNSNIRLRL